MDTTESIAVIAALAFLYVAVGGISYRLGKASRKKQKGGSSMRAPTLIVYVALFALVGIAIVACESADAMTGNTQPHRCYAIQQYLHAPMREVPCDREVPTPAPEPEPEPTPETPLPPVEPSPAPPACDQPSVSPPVVQPRYRRHVHRRGVLALRDRRAVR